MQNGKVLETKNFATQNKAFANFAKRCAPLPHHTKKSNKIGAKYTHFAFCLLDTLPIVVYTVFVEVCLSQYNKESTTAVQQK